MKHIGIVCMSACLFVLICLLYNNTVFAVDKYDSFNMVFSGYGDYVYQEKTEKYRLSDINELFAEDDGAETVKYYSAKVEYSKSAYDADEIVDVIRDKEGFLNASRDEVMYADEITDLRYDPYIDRQWYLNAIGAYDAWNMLEDEPGRGVVVAVIDSGVNYYHSDLYNNMWINEAEAYGNYGTDDDGNGIEDDIYGACFDSENVYGEKVTGDPFDTDEDGHGTHVAGIIGMENGNGGGRGIAYGCRIMAVKAGGSDGKFLISDVISAVDYAVKMGADVINMSFGSVNQSDVLEALLESASEKTVLVAAAGNEGTSSGESKMYPAAYPFVIGVMASDSSYNIAQWSNYDSRDKNVVSYDIAAPGVNIYSTVFDDKYIYMNGTSMAAPVVSASAAVVFHDAKVKGIQDPAKYTFGQLINSSRHTATYTDGQKNVYTYNNVNIYDALTVKPSVSMNVCGFKYFADSTGEAFADTVFLKDGRANIYCGYDILNTWRDAKNVKVSISTESAGCSIINGELEAGDIEALGKKSVSYDDNNAMMFEFNGEKGKSYKVKIIYTVTGQTADEPAVTVSQSYEDVITVLSGSEMTDMAVVAPSAVSYAADSVYTTLQKPAKVKNLKVYKMKSGKYRKRTLKWKKVSKADKYVVYYSVKKNGNYKKLAVCNKNRYVHKYKQNKRFYYKVRAYIKSGSDKVYGKYSRIVRG